MICIENNEILKITFFVTNISQLCLQATGQGKIQNLFFKNNKKRETS